MGAFCLYGFVVVVGSCIVLRGTCVGMYEEVSAMELEGARML